MRRMITTKQTNVIEKLETGLIEAPLVGDTISQIHISQDSDGNPWIYGENNEVYSLALGRNEYGDPVLVISGGEDGIYIPLVSIAELLIYEGNNLIVSGLPTVDPLIEGALWNDNGTLKISAGE